MYTFNTTSSTNYDIALEYSQSISTGIYQILHHSHFNIMTGKFSTEGMDTSFISDIKDTHYKRRALDEYAEYLDEHSDSNPDVLNDVIEVLRYEDEHPEDATAVNEMLEPLVELPTTYRPYGLIEVGDSREQRVLDHDGITIGRGFSY